MSCPYCEGPDCDTDCYACAKIADYTRPTAAQLRAQGEQLPDRLKTCHSCKATDLSIDAQRTCSTCVAELHAKIERLTKELERVNRLKDGLATLAVQHHGERDRIRTNWVKEEREWATLNADLRDQLMVKENERHAAEMKLIDAEYHRDVYKHLVRQLCDSMHPHPKEHPAMYAAKKAAVKVLEDGPPPAEEASHGS